MISDERIKMMESTLDEHLGGGIFPHGTFAGYMLELLNERKQLVAIAYAAERVQDKTIGLEWSCDQVLTKAMEVWRKKSDDSYSPLGNQGV